jgi:hypothetical protein
VLLFRLKGTNIIGIISISISISVLFPMDILEDFYPLYQDNPYNTNKDSIDTSDSESIEYVPKNKFNSFTPIKNPKAARNYDNWACRHSDDLWYFWCMCQEYTQVNCLPFMDAMSFADFSMMCYKNSINKLK